MLIQRKEFTKENLVAESRSNNREIIHLDKPKLDIYFNTIVTKITADTGLTYSTFSDYLLKMNLNF